MMEMGLVKTNSRPPANDHAIPLGVADLKLGAVALTETDFWLIKFLI